MFTPEYQQQLEARLSAEFDSVVSRVQPVLNRETLKQLIRIINDLPGSEENRLIESLLESAKKFLDEVAGDGALLGGNPNELLTNPQAAKAAYDVLKAQAQELLLTQPSYTRLRQTLDFTQKCIQEVQTNDHHRPSSPGRRG